jgi:RimJ/RimL family protein N-acetyltransferase
MNLPVITTSRLTLRAWTMQDVDRLFDILQEENILQYFPVPSAPSHEKVERYISNQLAHWEKYGYGHWAIVTRETGQLVGWNGLEYLPELKETEVAYLLSKQSWGCGYATEAASAAIRFGFEQASLDAIIGLVHAANTASVHVLEKCGLTFNDQIILWGMELRRYRLVRAVFESPASTQPL